MEFIYQLVGRGDLTHAKCLREKCYEKIRQRDREFAPITTGAKNDSNMNPASLQPVRITHAVSTRTCTLLSFKSEQLAEQMTLLDAQLFYKIQVSVHCFLITKSLPGDHRSSC